MAAVMPIDTYGNDASELLASVYGAATSADAWPEVLDRCAARVGSRSAALLTIDRLDPEGYTFGALAKVLRETLRGEHLERWLTELAPLEGDAHPYMLRQSVRTLVTDLDIWPDREALRRRADWAFLHELSGIGHRLFSRLNDNPRWVEILAFQFPAELPDVPDAARAPMRELLPHVAKSVEMANLFGALERRYRAVLAVLDRVGIGLCILDPAGRVLVTNAEADRILDAGHGLELTRGRLRCARDENARRLDGALRHASIGASGLATRPESLLSVRRDASADPVIVEVVPLRDRLGELGPDTDAVLVQLVDTGSRAHCDTAGFARAWALTPAERGVAELIVQGLTNAEIAESRGVGAATIKTQVTGVMRKCRVASRIELVRAILKTVPPLATPDRSG